MSEKHRHITEEIVQPKHEHPGTQSLEHRILLSEKKRIGRIVEIIADGVYSQLKNSGLLSENSSRSDKIRQIKEKTKGIEDLEAEVTESLNEEKKTLTFM